MSLENTRDIGTAKIVMVNAGGGASSLADLTDTNISNPSNGQVLEYDSASSKWINATGSSGGQYQNVRYAKINTQETQSSVIYLKTDLVHNLATGDELKVYDIVYLESDTLRVLPTGYSWKVGIKVDNTNYVDFVLEKSGGANWTGVIPANSILVLELIISPSVATKYAYVRGVITDDGFVRSGAKSGTTIGANATAEGYQTTASGLKSHAEGETTKAVGANSHAEGMGATAAELASHAEGAGTLARGMYSHAEGYQTTAYTISHAEGSNCVAGTSEDSTNNQYAHAEGVGTIASGSASHAGGYYTKAQYDYQRAIGKYNDNKSTTLLEVGNGTGNNARSNAFEVYSDGKISCDNGSSKFQFTQNNGSDGYYDASGTFHAFGGDSYALVGMGQVTSYSNKVADTNVYLHRAPKEGDRLFIKFSPTITDSDAQIKIYDEASGTAYTLSFNFWASGSKLAGLCLLEVQDNGFGTLGLTLKYSFEGGTNYTAGTGIEINGSAISNTAPNYGVDVDGATISSVSSGNLGTYVGESKYLILYFSASASPYSGGYTLTLSYSGSVSVQEYGTLYDGSSRYNSNISAGTMLLCEVTDTGTGSSADPVHVNIIGKIDPNSGGASTLSDLTDTSITSPSNGQVLTYNSTSGKWENQAASGGNSISLLENGVTALAGSWGSPSITLTNVNRTMQNEFTVACKRISYTGSSGSYGFVGLFSNNSFDISKIKRVVMSLYFDSDPSMTSDTYGYQYKLGFPASINTTAIETISNTPIVQINKPYDDFDDTNLVHDFEFIIPDNMPSYTRKVAIAFLANKGKTVVQNIVSLRIDFK